MGVFGSRFWLVGQLIGSPLGDRRCWSVSANDIVSQFEFSQGRADFSLMAGKGA